MLNAGSLVLIFLAIVISLIPHDMMYGPQAALIATWLFAQYGSAYAVAFYILVCAILTLVATSMMTDSRARTSRENTSSARAAPVRWRWRHVGTYRHHRPVAAFSRRLKHQ